MSEDFMQAIDQKCGTTHSWTALSVFSSTTSGVFMLFTIPLNAVIVYVLIKERKKKYNSLFYKLLLNIAIADLLTGLIADPSAVNALAKEAMGTKLILLEVYVVHVSLFFTDAVALLTLTVLSTDRIIALVYPTKHFKGINKKAGICLVLSVWPIAFCLVIPYFTINFIRQLLIFSIVNIVVTVLSLIVTTITYRRKLSIKPRTTSSSDDGSFVRMNELNKEEEASQDESRSTSPQAPPKNETSKKPDIQLSRKQVKNQQKATRTFILMLVVFVATYFPTAVTMIYMNVCTKCDCLSIHIMRDISILCILSSSVLRPLNFILTLKHLKSSVLNTIKRVKPEQKGYNVSTTSQVTAQ